MQLSFGHYKAWESLPLCLSISTFQVKKALPRSLSNQFSVWVPIFPKWGSFSIPAFHGLFSASGGILLIMKYLYVEFDYQLEEMMYFYASITVIMHIQTFFFTPITVVPKNAAVEDYSAFNHVSWSNWYHDTFHIKAVFSSMKIVSMKYSSMNIPCWLEYSSMKIASLGKIHM